MMVAEITFGPHRSNESPDLSDVYIRKAATILSKSSSSSIGATSLGGFWLAILSKSTTVILYLPQMYTETGV